MRNPHRQTGQALIVSLDQLAPPGDEHIESAHLACAEGRLQIRSYETQDGQKRKVAEVVADGVRFLDRGRSSAAEPAPAATAATPAPAQEDAAPGGGDEEDVPF